MKPEHPHSRHIPGLRQLWKTVFGDSDTFLDRFFSAAYAPEQCLCALEGDTPIGMLYWLPCGKYAYIYAVATHPDHRGKGICRDLMEAAHGAIAAQGYRGTLLYPQEEGLRTMYRKMGYIHETHIREYRCYAGDTPVALEEITPHAYFTLRRQLLPSGAVDQGAPFPQMVADLRFFRGNGFLLAADGGNGAFLAQEFLGDPSLLPGILNTLGKAGGTFRCPGGEIPFAMVHLPEKDADAPGYFAFPLD